MQTRLALLASIVLAASYGCAIEPEQKQPPGAATSATARAPSQSESRTYRTGSRLPALEDDRGSSMVGGVSKDDYAHDRDASAAPMRGN